MTPNAAEGMTVLTEDVVRDLRRCFSIYTGTDRDTIVALCDHWLATTPATASGGIKLPVRVAGIYGASREIRDNENVLVCYAEKPFYDAIVSALNSSGK